MNVTFRLLLCCFVTFRLLLSISKREILLYWVNLSKRGGKDGAFQGLWFVEGDGEGGWGSLHYCYL